MITLFRKDNCFKCEEIEEKLKELVLAYKVYTPEDKEYQELPVDVLIPAIRDDNKFYCTESRLNNYFEELEKTVALWRKYQVDACYIDDDSKESC